MMDVTEFKTLFGASSESLMGEEQGLREEAAKMRDHKAELVRQRDDGLRGIIDRALGTHTASGILFKSEAQRKIDETAAQAGQIENEANTKAEQRRERFKTDGQLDLTIGEKLASGDC